MKIKVHLLACLLFFVFIACHSSKKNQGTHSEIIDKEDIIRFVNEPDSMISTVKARIYVSLKSENVKREFTLNLKMIRDSLIYTSITAVLGIELFRILIDQDSFVMLDRLNKQGWKGSNHLLETLFPFKGLSYRNLENVIMGKSFFLVEKDFKFKKENNLVLFQKEDLIASKYVYFDLDEQTVKECMYHDVSNTQMAIYYKGAISDGDFTFPSEITCTLKPVNISVLLQYQSLKINQELDIKLRVPDSYEMVDL